MSNRYFLNTDGAPVQKFKLPYIHNTTLTLQRKKIG